MFLLVHASCIVEFYLDIFLAQYPVLTQEELKLVAQRVALLIAGLNGSIHIL